MNHLQCSCMTRLSLPKNRNFWISMLWFALAILNAFIMLVDWHEAARWDLFRYIMHVIIGSILGFERYHKYRAQLIETKRPEDAEV